MSHPRLCRMLAVLTLTFALAVPCAHGADRPGAGTQRSAEPASLAPLHLLVSLWATLTSAWGNAGCEADPFGVTHCAPTGPAAGSSAPATEQEAGCELDPYGVSICSPATGGGAS